jgi:hypothetical protein
MALLKPIQPNMGSRPKRLNKQETIETIKTLIRNMETWVNIREMGKQILNAKLETWGNNHITLKGMGHCIWFKWHEHVIIILGNLNAFFVTISSLH